jgi:glycosyltransferase involved in cell wall biosynthesis
MKHYEPHIIYIITKLELGGAQKVCLSLVEGLGPRATLITGKEGPLVARVANNPNVILMKELTREVRFFGFINELRCFFKLIGILRQLKKKYPHAIVHTHSTKAGLLGRWAAFFAGIRTRMHTVHGYAFHEHQTKVAWFLIYFTELITSFITTHFICVSSADAKTGIKLLPWFASKHSIIRAAVDHGQFFVPARISKPMRPITSDDVSGVALKTKPEARGNESTRDTVKNTFIFGTIACFKPQKNLFDLLQAFEYAYKKNPHIRLELIGDGQLRPTIETWIFEHKLNKVITLHGWQNHVTLIMMHWHAFVLTSLWEGLPCAIIEARLQKLPVISYNTGGIHDVIMDGENGLLYPQKEWRQFAQGMIEVSTNQELYKKLCGYRDELEDFKISTMVEQHQNLYKQV